MRYISRNFESTGLDRKLLMRFVLRTVLLTAILFAGVTPALGERGTVVSKQDGCDYFVVAASSAYDVLELFRGQDPDEGDVLVGGYHSYGRHDIHDETTNDDLTVWVESYDLSKEDALETLVEKCSGSQQG